MAAGRALSRFGAGQGDVEDDQQGVAYRAGPAGVDTIDSTWTFSGSGVEADAAWTLRITDGARADQGRLSSWAPRF